MKTHGRLAALGALGVAAGATGLYVLFWYISRRTPTGGMDWEHSVLTWVSVAVVIAAVIGAHVAFARQLRAYARDQE